MPSMRKIETQTAVIECVACLENEIADLRKELEGDILASPQGAESQFRLRRSIQEELRQKINLLKRTNNFHPNYRKMLSCLNTNVYCPDNTISDIKCDMCNTKVDSVVALQTNSNYITVCGPCLFKAFHLHEEDVLPA